MWCRMMLAVGSLLATVSQAYAPIQGQGQGLLILPKGFPGNMRGASTPQTLSIRNVAADEFPRLIPYFTAKIDQTITWDDMDWCLEATGSNYGDVVRVNSCSHAQTQKWTWIPDGRGYNMIQLKDTELCLDAIGKEVVSNGIPIELRVCGSEVVLWRFEEPLPLPRTSQGDAFLYGLRHETIILFTLVGVGAVSLGAWIWQVSANGNQDQETVRAVMAVDPMYPARAAQPGVVRTGDISVAEYTAARNYLAPPPVQTVGVLADLALRLPREVRYFAYGANTCRATLDRRRLQPIRSSPAVLEDWRLSFSVPGVPFIEPGFASVQPSSGDVCHGVLHYLSPLDFARMCASEGVPVGYQVIKVNVQEYGANENYDSLRSALPRVEAYTLQYVNPSPFFRPREFKPSRRYLGLIRSGAEEFGLDEEWKKTLDSIQHA